MVEDSRSRSLVLFLLIARLAPCSYAILNRRDVGLDERATLLITQPQKRDATLCPTDYSLCPASLGGGCCPTDRSCGVSSCYPTTAPPPTECSKSGYIACNIDQGGGCCPSGYSCARNGCIPPAGSTFTEDCGTGSYMCPSSVGYGCCRSGLACGNGYCYETSFSSVTLTVTIITTDSKSQTETITTVVQTAYSNVAQPAATSAAASPTVTTSTAPAIAVPKVDASSAPSSGGLTQVQIGGIIGAAVAVVIVVIIATFLIIRRLNAVVKEAKATAARRGGSGSNTKSSGRPHPHRPTPSSGNSGIDDTSVDPLMSPSRPNQSPSSVGLPRPSAVYSLRSDPEQGGSPPIPTSYGSPQGHARGYERVPMSESHYSEVDGHYRSHGVDSENHSPSTGVDAGGYFDAIDPALRDQNLRFGHPPSRPSLQSHGRQRSDASDVSQLSGSSDIIELDASPHGDRASNVQRAMQGVGFSRIDNRRQGQEGRKRSASSGAILGAAPGMIQRLENVQESELDIKGKSVGAATTERELTDAEAAEQMYGLEIAPIPHLERERERREQQKVKGNMRSLRRDRL